MKLSNIAAAKSTCRALGLGAALFIVGLPVANASTVTLDFAAATGGLIKFDGHNHFSFLKGFNVTDPLSSAGFQGSIGGIFTFNTAGNVTGTGTITIADPTGVHGTFKGNVDWLTITTTGALGGLNYNADINISGDSFTPGSGTNSTDLKALWKDPAIATLTFQFTSPKNLQYLATHTVSTSYSGSITTVVPLPAAAWLFGSALLGMGAFGRSKQPAQKEETAA